jgi:energy-coupling factor transporter ATP-binding protein EcfA2
MITSVHFRNFKGIQRADVALERLTVIVGPNASGKTSILEGLHFLSRLGTENPAQIFQDEQLRLLRHHRIGTDEPMELSCTDPRGSIRLIFPIKEEERTLKSPLRLLQSATAQLTRVEGKRGEAPSEHPNELADQAKDWQPIVNIPVAAQVFRPAELLRLDASKMAAPTLGMGKRIASDGAGLASALTYLALNQPDDFQTIQQRLKTVVPSVVRVRFDRIGNNLPQGFGNAQYKENIVFDFRGSSDISAHLASEGTILVLGLLTVLMGRDRPNLVLLDDLDRALHPKAQREVIGLIRTVLDQNPDLQIVATTHSPYLVDSLRPEEVRLTTIGEDGTFSCASLVEHPDFEKWKDEMAPGEMWSLFGEQWVGELKKAHGGD